MACDVRPREQRLAGPGRRGTIAADGDRLYVSSGIGALYCVSSADGTTLWWVDIKKEFQGQAAMWDLSESPLVDGNLVFATPGGPESTVVALDNMTGKTVWRCNAGSEGPSYCSAVVFQREGRRLLVTMTADSVIGMDVKDGALLWHPPRLPASASTPSSRFLKAISSTTLRGMALAAAHLR